MTEAILSLKLKDRLGPPRLPYYYHTCPITDGKTQVLQDRLTTRQLNSRSSSPIQFTADKVNLKTGKLLANGLTDEAYQAIAGRKLTEGRVTLVFNSSLERNTTFRSWEEAGRFPEVEQTNLDPLVALLVKPQDTETVRQIAQQSGLDIPVVTEEEWQDYAYTTDQNIVGGLAVPQQVTAGVALIQEGGETQTPTPYPEYLEPPQDEEVYDILRRIVPYKDQSTAPEAHELNRLMQEGMSAEQIFDTQPHLRAWLKSVQTAFLQ